MALGAVSCPSGYIEIEEPYITTVESCPSGTVFVGDAFACSEGSLYGVCWIVEQLRALCGAGLTQIKVSNGLSIPLYADKLTSPSIHVKYNNVTCYADLESGRASDAINLGVGGVIYHTVK